MTKTKIKIAKKRYCGCGREFIKLKRNFSINMAGEVYDVTGFVWYCPDCEKEKIATSKVMIYRDNVISDEDGTDVLSCDICGSELERTRRKMTGMINGTAYTIDTDVLYCSACSFMKPDTNAVIIYEDDDETNTLSEAKRPKGGTLPEYEPAEAVPENVSGSADFIPVEEADCNQEVIGLPETKEPEVSVAVEPENPIKDEDEQAGMRLDDYTEADDAPEPPDPFADDAAKTVPPVDPDIETDKSESFETEKESESKTEESETPDGQSHEDEEEMKDEAQSGQETIDPKSFGSFVSGSPQIKQNDILTEWYDEEQKEEETEKPSFGKGIKSRIKNIFRKKEPETYPTRQPENVSQVLGGVLYDTSKADLVCAVPAKYTGYGEARRFVMVYYYKTKKGRFFSIDVSNDREDEFTVLDVQQMKTVLKSRPDLYRKFIGDYEV